MGLHKALVRTVQQECMVYWRLKCRQNKCILDTNGQSFLVRCLSMIRLQRGWMISAELSWGLWRRTRQSLYEVWQVALQWHFSSRRHLGAGDRRLSAFHTIVVYMCLLHFVWPNTGFQKSYCSHNCVAKCAKSCRET